MDALLLQTTGIGWAVIGVILGGAAVGVLQIIVKKAKAKTFQEDLHRQIEGAKKEAENLIKSAQIEAASEAIKRKEKFNDEENRKRAELRETEIRLSKREDLLDRQIDQVQKRETVAKEQENELERKTAF